jgi:hypothetical protein
VSNREPAVLLPEMTSSAAEQQERQQRALTTIRDISHRVGRELPVWCAGDGTQFADDPGLYVLDPKLTEAGYIEGTAFEVEPRMLSGAADSAHAVLSGYLAVEYGGKTDKVDIAAKAYQKRSFEDRFARVRREVLVTRLMAEKGELALTPVAVAIGPEQQDRPVVLFTRLAEDLYTLDNNPWNRGAGNIANVQNAATAADALGRFNSYGRQHGDAKIKNVAATTDGKVGMIDFETTKEFDLTDPLQVAETVHVDFGLLLKSLVRKGMFTPRFDHYGYQTNGDAIKGALDKMVDAYMGSWQVGDIEVGFAAYETLQAVIQAEVPGAAQLVTV